LPSYSPPRPSPFGRPTRALFTALLGVAFVGGALAACKPSIGDKCVLSTDCSTQGDRLCDTSQPDGYCTEFNCAADSCPDHAVCVLFNSNVQGCGYDDRNGAFGSRVARAFCVAQCGRDSDCRGGYVCRSPKGDPWNGLILDANQTYLTCLVPPLVGLDADGGDASIMSPGAPPPVCSAVAPDAGSISLTTTTTPEAGTLPPLVGPDAGSTDGGDGGDGG
jgi:hypothetical protein